MCLKLLGVFTLTLTLDLFHTLCVYINMLNIYTYTYSCADILVHSTQPVHKYDITMACMYVCVNIHPCETNSRESHGIDVCWYIY
jgi:hypothetical protein